MRIDSISRVGFAAVSLGSTGFDDNETEAEAKVVVFSVDAFTGLLNRTSGGIRAETYGYEFDNG